MSLPDIAGYELQTLIGSGSCGAVYRARSADGRECAVKVLSSMAINRKALTTALLGLQAMPEHPGILRPTAFSMDRSPYFFVMPLAGGAASDSHGRSRWKTLTLEDLCLEGVTAEQAWDLIGQMSDAVAWLHQNGLVHGNLRPGNVLVSTQPELKLRLTDSAQGWVGGIHHLELGDHFVYLCPDQAENPDAVFSASGLGWDVYSFGVIAYRLLTGRLPRADAEWDRQLELAERQVAAGLAYRIDGAALINAIRSAPPVTWNGPASDPWEQRRREVIERALDLNPDYRWIDMRAVQRQFEIIESERLLEESRAQTVAERRKQAARIRRLQAVATGFAAVWVLASAYAGITLFRALEAEKTITANLETYQRESADRVAQVASLTMERDQSRRSKEVADANLKHSQTAVDRFLTQLLQTPTSNALEVEFSKSQLEDALAFSLKNLENLEGDPALAIERARTYGNLGQIYLKLHQDDLAIEYLEKARDSAANLLQADPDPARAPLFHQWQGRYSWMLSDLLRRSAQIPLADQRLKESTDHLQKGLAADPSNRLARTECARAWLELGARSFTTGDIAGAESSLKQVSEVLAKENLGPEPSKDEVFILARADFQTGLVWRHQGRFEEALQKMIDAVQAMGDLVMGSSPRNQEQAIKLAETYTVLAELVGLHFNANDALAAHNQAVPILLELNRLHPDWAEAKYWLARNQGSVAQLERDLGEAATAMKKKQDAIELINEVLADHPNNPTYLALQAKLRGEYAGFLVDQNKSKEGLAIVVQAIETLTQLLKEPSESQASITPERREWMIYLGQFLGIQGHASQQSNQRTAAKTAFASAQQVWQDLIAAGQNDEVIQQGLAWSQDRLQKLK